MVRGTKWMVGALAAALWVIPAAAQTGSTSTGQEHPYKTGTGTDPTRSNTDPDQAAASASGTAGTAGTSMSPGAAGTAAGARTGMTEPLSMLHQGNQEEIAAGSWMEQHAQNGKVKDFAKKMVKDHGKMDKDVMSFAQKKGIDLASAAPSTAKLDEIKSMSGPQADRAYMDMMVQDHEKDVKETRTAEKQAKGAHEKDLASLLGKSAKKMEGHLKDARKIQHDLSQRQARAPGK